MNSNLCPLVTPYGGRLVDLSVAAEAMEERRAYASRLPSLQLSPRSVCDLELLAGGALSPLDGFMGRADYQRVLAEMRLADGSLFPTPITLPVEARQEMHLDQDLALRNHEYELLGILTVKEIYPWDRNAFADRVFGTRDIRHPLVAELQRWGALLLSGCLQVLRLPAHYDFPMVWFTPAQARARLATMGWQKVLAYPLQGAWTRADAALLAAAAGFDGPLLLPVAAGLARPGDFEHFTRVRLYQALVERCLPPDRTLLALLPLVHRMAGARQKLWQALICRNYGANHVLVDRDPDDPGLVERYSQELGVRLITAGDLAASRPASGALAPPRAGEPPNPGRAPKGSCIPRQAAQILARSRPPRHRQGVCIWFTGLSGAGKSTTAEILTWQLMQHGRRVTVLDGDVVRTHLSKGLGFSKEDRDANVRRIGFVAAELVQIGGVVVCAVVSPYRAARNDVRNLVGADHFVEVFVDTPLEVCEARDVKGMYAQARRGALNGFTGIDDPYEPPRHPEITLDTMRHTPQENVGRILAYLIQQGFIRQQNPNHRSHEAGVE